MTRRIRPIAGAVAVTGALVLSSCASINVNAIPQPGASYSDGYDIVMKFESVLNLPERAKVVLDGVTPPPDNGACVHSVPWFTARLGGALLELTVARRGSALAQCLAEAISRTAQAHRATCDLSHPLTPQATVVVARWDEAEVEYLVLSDSVLPKSVLPSV